MTSDAWRTRRLGDLCRFTGGGAFPKSEQGAASGEHPFVKVSDLASDANTRRIQVANNWVSDAQITSMKSKLMPAGSVIFAKIGEGLKSERLSTLTRPTAIDNNLMAAIPREGEIDEDYLYFLLSQVGLSDWAQGSALPYLRQSDLEEIPVLVPPLDEQRRIAGVLGALDDLIEVNRGLARDCEHLAQALASSASSQTSLSALATWGGLSTVKPVGLVDHYSLPAFDDGRRAERVDGGTIKSNKQRIEQPCVLVARLNPHIPRVWMVYPDESVASLASTEFVPLTGNEVAQEVVYAVCSAPAFLEQMGGLVTGTTGSHQRVDKDALTSVAVPDVRTLESKVLVAITQLVRQAHALRVEIGELAATRDELLPLLMSGRVRVSEAVAA